MKLEVSHDTVPIDDQDWQDIFSSPKSGHYINFTMGFPLLQCFVDVLDSKSVGYKGGTLSIRKNLESASGDQCCH